MDYWSPGNQIYFHEGMAWSSTKTLQPCCIGSEENVLKAMEANTPTGNPAFDNILTMEQHSYAKDAEPIRVRRRKRK